MTRQSDPYADVLAGGKLEHLLEHAFQTGGGEWSSARELSEALVAQAASCEFLVSKGQIRIAFDLRPTAAPEGDS
jgi:hypothetical protein